MASINPLNAAVQQFAVKNKNCLRTEVPSWSAYYFQFGCPRGLLCNFSDPDSSTQLSLSHRLRIRILRILKVHKILDFLRILIQSILKFKLLHSSPPSSNELFVANTALNFWVNNSVVNNSRFVNSSTVQYDHIEQPVTKSTNRLQLHCLPQCSNRSPHQAIAHWFHSAVASVIECCANSKTLQLLVTNFYEFLTQKSRILNPSMPYHWDLRVVDDKHWQVMSIVCRIVTVIICQWEWLEAGVQLAFRQRVCYLSSCAQSQRTEHGNHCHKMIVPYTVIKNGSAFGNYFISTELNSVSNKVWN